MDYHGTSIHRETNFHDVQMTQRNSRVKVDEDFEVNGKEGRSKELVLDIFCGLGNMFMC